MVLILKIIAILPFLIIRLRNMSEKDFSNSKIYMIKALGGHEYYLGSTT